MPEISFKEMLMVPDGPPDSVWERALDAAYSTAEQDASTDDASPEPAAPGTEDADFLAANGDGSDSAPMADHDGPASTAWDGGDGPHAGHDVGDGPDGGYDDGDGPHAGHDVGDGLSGGGDDDGSGPDGGHDVGDSLSGGGDDFGY
jgi:hypothetical protein